MNNSKLENRIGRIAEISVNVVLFFLRIQLCGTGRLQKSLPCKMAL